MKDDESQKKLEPSKKIKLEDFESVDSYLKAIIHEARREYSKEKENKD